MKHIRFSINSQPCQRLPDCCGLYRFIGAKERLLYVGKSVHIRTRVLSHFSSSANTSMRQRRMLHATVRVDCQPTAGELGALLLENRAIKTEQPLYNRRQRELRRLWTLILKPSESEFLQAHPSPFLPDQPDTRDHYGLYPSRHACNTMLTSLTREHGLCPRALGLEQGRGACFQYQIGRCHGACCGQESAETHNARLVSLLEEQRILAWPFAGRIRIEECCQQPCAQQPKRQWHHVDGWAYLGSTRRRNGAVSRNCPFDRDAYLILLKALTLGAFTLLDEQGQTIDNPLSAARSMPP